MGNTLGRILVYAAPGSASWGTESPCTKCLKICRFPTQDLILGKSLPGELMEASVCLSVWEGEDFFCIVDCFFG